MKQNTKNVYKQQWKLDNIGKNEIEKDLPRLQQCLQSQARKHFGPSLKHGKCESKPRQRYELSDRLQFNRCRRDVRLLQEVGHLECSRSLG
ncbi:MAG: hypothetical protein F6K41_12875 [Symploca sp. SIO3E6]|nr:hypothetical protein [Caldora sp. SIO3E6]